ncbi:hypothetical protein [Nocardiopsis protaetiae]|uniref:hypothetical protein n=1 Tax=Nocardiopsis protaetiae TaxID=3382270 RepID=UPI00387A8EF0
MPLVGLLWERGIGTRSCCQDYGDLLALHAPGLPVGDPGWVAFFTGRVWVEIDTDDTDSLMRVLVRDGELRLAMSQWGLPGSWMWVRPVLPDMVGEGARAAGSTHLFFPREHLDRVVRVLRSADH